MKKKKMKYSTHMDKSRVVRKKCPILEASSTSSSYCIKERCEWWIKDYQLNKCAIVSLVDLLWESN